MIPVAAAAMEQGAYRRCYDYLIRLQVLDEIETLSNLSDITEESIEKDEDITERSRFRKPDNDIPPEQPRYKIFRI